MESVSEVEAAAERLAEQAGIDEEDRFRVTMAVREAAVNAVLHGNEYDPAKKITVSLENTGSALVITIADQGRGPGSGVGSRPTRAGKSLARNWPRHLSHSILYG